MDGSYPDVSTWNIEIIPMAKQGDGWVLFAYFISTNNDHDIELTKIYYLFQQFLWIVAITMHGTLGWRSVYCRSKPAKGWRLQASDKCTDSFGENKQAWHCETEGRHAREDWRMRIIGLASWKARFLKIEVEGAFLQWYLCPFSLFLCWMWSFRSVTRLPSCYEFVRLVAPVFCPLVCWTSIFIAIFHISLNHKVSKYLLEVAFIYI